MGGNFNSYKKNLGGGVREGRREMIMVTRERCLKMWCFWNLGKWTWLDLHGSIKFSIYFNFWNFLSPAVVCWWFEVWTGNDIVVQNPSWNMQVKNIKLFRKPVIMLYELMNRVVVLDNYPPKAGKVWYHIYLINNERRFVRKNNRNDDVLFLFVRKWYGGIMNSLFSPNFLHF